MSSDTPRTDEVIRHFAGRAIDIPDYYTVLDFARQLERELAAAQSFPSALAGLHAGDIATLKAELAAARKDAARCCELEACLLDAYNVLASAKYVIRGREHTGFIDAAQKRIRATIGGQP